MATVTFIARNSDEPERVLSLASFLGRQDRTKEAVAILEKLAAEIPESAKVQESLARALLGVGETTKAREHATRIAKGARY